MVYNNGSLDCFLNLQRVDYNPIKAFRIFGNLKLSILIIL